jgi:hypothetical protein
MNPHAQTVAAHTEYACLWNRVAIIIQHLHFVQKMGASTRGDTLIHVFAIIQQASTAGFVIKQGAFLQQPAGSLGAQHCLASRLAW